MSTFYFFCSFFLSSFNRSNLLDADLWVSFPAGKLFYDKASVFDIEGYKWNTFAWWILKLQIGRLFLVNWSQF